MELKTERLNIPQDCNHYRRSNPFYQDIEDVYEIIGWFNPRPEVRCCLLRSLRPLLIRKAGNDEEMITAAVDNAQKIAGPGILLLS